MAHLAVMTIVLLCGLCALASTTAAASALTSLVGDYRFHHDAPGANQVTGRLPDIVISEKTLKWWDKSPSPEGADLGHGVLSTAEIPNPVLRGYLPVGGTGDAPSNNWALCWTREAAEIPAHPDLDLGERFTLWMRFAYVGAARAGEYGAKTVVLLERWREAPDRAFRLTCEYPGFVRLSISGDGRDSEQLTASASRMRLQQAVWYDLAVVFDRGRVTFYQTAIGEAGPGPTVKQTMSASAFRSMASVAGPLKVAKHMGMVERVRIYRGEALGLGQVESLSAGVRMPVWNDAGRAEVGNDTQLFLDDGVIESMTGLVRRWHQVEKHPGNPLFVAHKINCYFTVMRDEEDDLYKMWYLAWPEHCYATSRDGIVWEKPVLNVKGPDNRTSVAKFSASYPTQLLYVWKDPDDPIPGQTYQAFALVQGFIAHYVSADGFVWKYRQLAACGTDDTPASTYAPWLDRYVHVIRPLMVGKPPGYRTIAVADSPTPGMDQIQPWKLVFTPDAIDRAADPDLQFYGMPIGQYEKTLIGLLWIFHSGAAQTIEVQLAFSRDGRNWMRPKDRQPLIRLGPKGAWDSGMIYSGSNLLLVDDEIRIYYAAYPNTHNQAPKHPQGIGLGTLRRDGFVSLYAGETAGTLITRPFPCEGKMLSINADVPDGSVRVEVQDGNGTPVTGFRLEDCRPFQGDAVRHRVAWKDGEDLSGLAGRKIRLRFVVQRGHLYSFRLAP